MSWLLVKLCRVIFQNSAKMIIVCFELSRSLATTDTFGFNSLFDVTKHMLN